MNYEDRSVLSGIREKGVAVLQIRNTESHATNIAVHQEAAFPLSAEFSVGEEIAVPAEGGKRRFALISREEERTLLVYTRLAYGRRITILPKGFRLGAWRLGGSVPECVPSRQARGAARRRIIFREH